MEVKKWWKEAVIYQIYPKSFCDSNGDGIGDIPGIISKLDYVKDLGVDALWICPMYPSPGYDNGYDISDYEAIDPVFGTMEDFNCLVKEVHRRGMKLIIDLVINHTSDLHPWFLSARRRKEDPLRDYYIWQDPKPDGSPPNNWGALFGGSAWTWDEASGQYYLGLFSSRQPDLNWKNPDLRQALYGMIRRWLERGVDGFRMDVISLIAKPEDYADGPLGQSGFHDPRARAAANPMVHEYLKEMRREALAGFDVVTVGEASATSLEEAQRFTNPDGSELDMVFQFEHMDLDGGETFKWTDNTIPLDGLKSVMSKWQKGMYHRGWNGQFWNNHDQPRMVSRMGDQGTLREASAKMLAVCLHMHQGTPFVFQGEELGITNPVFTDVTQLWDSESINAYHKLVSSGVLSKEEMLRFISMKSRDCARTPMHWDDTTNAGFTSGMPWMMVNPNYPQIHAAEQQGRADSVLEFYKKLIALRKQYPALTYGEYFPYQEEAPNVYACYRTLPEETLLICCNFSCETQSLPVPDGFKKGELLLGNYAGSSWREDGRLKPFEAVILRKEGNQ